MLKTQGKPDLQPNLSWRNEVNLGESGDSGESGDFEERVSGT